MEASILIVSRNRKQALEQTLQKLEPLVDPIKHEVLVYLDGCSDDSIGLKTSFSWVKWYESPVGLGASPARHKLYNQACGEVLIGLDDDAHPVTKDFISVCNGLFEQYSNVGIVAFEEIKGVFVSDEEALLNGNSERLEYITSEFIGCGFAIKKEVYEKSNGFPVWMDIYGEEACVSLEVMNLGYDILYSNQIKVNHRVDKKERETSGKNYFRFERQLVNSSKYYLIYYRNPLSKLLKLHWHNFRKYALTDATYFKLYFKAFTEVVLNVSKVLKYRDPVRSDIIEKRNQLKPIKF